MHRNGVMHGDVKPLNIMRCDGRVKLIDLDASASLLNGYSGGKSSSAYLPPCLLVGEISGNDSLVFVHCMIHFALSLLSTIQGRKS